MKERIFQILQTKTVRHSAITFTGTITTGVLGMIFYILMARFLGPTNFGIFSISVLAITLISDIGNIGMDTGLVRFVGKYIDKDREKALRILKLSLKARIWISLFIVAVGWFVVPMVASNLLNKVEFISPLRIAIFGAASTLFFAFSLNSLQSIQKFLAWALLSIGMNATRLALIILLAVFGFLSLNLSIGVYTIIPFLGFFVGLLFLPRFLSVGGENQVAREFFNYNKWVAVFTAVAALSSRLDSFISARLLSLHEVGIYSVAVSLSSVVPQIVFALGVVVAPKLASLETKEKALVYLRKLQIFVLGLALAGLLAGIPLAYFLISYLYGIEYLGSFYPLTILLVSQAIFLISVPVHTAVIYYFAYPKLFVWISLVHLLIIVGLGYALIGTFGIIGAASTVLVGNLTNFIIPAIWTLREFSRRTSTKVI